MVQLNNITITQLEPLPTEPGSHRQPLPNLPQEINLNSELYAI